VSHSVVNELVLIVKHCAGELWCLLFINIGAIKMDKRLECLFLFTQDSKVLKMEQDVRLQLELFYLLYSGTC